MRVIAFASTKGGVGKSTAAAIAADGILRAGGTVRLIDLDPQGTLAKWARPISERNDALRLSRVEPKDDATFAHRYNAMLAEFEDETDWVLIDTAGTDDARRLAALAIADLVVCPSGPVEAELLGVQKTLHHLDLALKEAGSDADAAGMLRVLYRRPNGFPNAEMNRMRELIFGHFGAVDEIHHSSAIASFLGRRITTDEAIRDGADPGPFLKIQDAADRLTASLKGQFDE